ncbi:putative secondary metabolism biosynthetic enzyme [Myotisia sp. PD_48]|nr:putative secondary metabolism biosynthetic enzyme [Myotisia sp. PD_48]
MGSLGYADRATVDPTPLFSRRVQKWEPGVIRSLLPLEALPGMISLVAGKPNPETFPFAKISISLKDSNETIVLEESDLRDALQYGLPAGNSELIQWFEELQIKVHGIDANDGWACCVGNGSQELIHRAFQVFTDLGDPVLIETPAYPGVAGFLRADGHELVEAASDADGLDPSDLERILLEWPEQRRRPTVLYTVPTGSNPTGRSCTESRKAKILRLAQRFNFMIFEDDAYHFINFETVSSNRARSYLALEREMNGETGRVVRFDSLSKIISSGMRLGVATGPLPVIQKVIKITENINLQPSSTSQLLVLSLLRHWGHSGFLSHCARAADFYRQKRDAFAAAAERHLKGKATWDIPTAGMFFWFTLQLPPGKESFGLMSNQGMENGVLAIPGVGFMPNSRKTCQLRASYSLIAEAEMDEACMRIANLINEVWKQEIKSDSFK